MDIEEYSNRGWDLASAYARSAGALSGTVSTAIDSISSLIALCEENGLGDSLTCELEKAMLERLKAAKAEADKVFSKGDQS